MYEHYLVIYHYFQGSLNKDIGSIENLREHEMGINVNSYKSNGIHDLRMNRNSDVPHNLTKE